MQAFNTIEADKNSRTKSVFCFVIAPEMRRKGIAKLLLERVCEDAAKEGFDVAEAYPNKDFTDTARDFMGPKKLYEDSDFMEYCEIENKAIVRKSIAFSQN